MKTISVGLVLIMIFSLFSCVSLTLVPAGTNNKQLDEVNIINQKGMFSTPSTTEEAFHRGLVIMFVGMIIVSLILEVCRSLGL
jgi:ABC-type amino acid transport system permease subunit